MWTQRNDESETSPMFVRCGMTNVSRLLDYCFFHVGNGCVMNKEGIVIRLFFQHLECHVVPAINGVVAVKVQLAAK